MEKFQICNVVLTVNEFEVFTSRLKAVGND